MKMTLEQMQASYGDFHALLMEHTHLNPTEGKKQMLERVGIEGDVLDFLASLPLSDDHIGGVCHGLTFAFWYLGSNRNITA